MRAAATKSTTSSGVAWVWMTEVAVAGDELRRGHPRQAPGITDSGDKLQRGVRHGRRRTWPRRRARRGERRWRTRPPATWSSDCHLEFQHRRPPSMAPPLTPTSGSIRVAGRCALRRCPNSVAGPLRSASSPTVDPTATASAPVHGPHRSLSPATASSVGSSSPAAMSPAPSPRRILRRPRPTPELVAGALVAGATATTTQDPPPSTPHAGARRRRRLCHHAGLSAVHVTMLHAGACWRPRPPRWSSSSAAASSTPELGGGGRVRATGVSLVCAAPMVACALASEGGGPWIIRAWGQQASSIGAMPPWQWMRS
uniref:Uncharacterized protein n=1 Tax=Oryza barthii TaxID=65489 RepID=A0A0D3HCD4_9ORYZ